MQKTHDLSKHVRGGVLALALTVMVSGCGFSPVYSTGGSNVGPVIVEQIDGRAGYFLRQELDRHAVLEQGTEAPRTLTVKLVTSFASAALAVDGLSARTLYTMTANYTLKTATAAVTPISGVVTITVGYESLDQAYGDVALQADAEERAATQIADKVWADLRRQARATK
jgi:LPS-assembly lipoprotein